MSELYTNSRLRVLRQCLRLHFYRYVLGIRSASTPEAMFGTVGHAALEAYLRAWMEWAPDGPPVPCDENQLGLAEDLDTARLSVALAAISASQLSPWDQLKLRLLLIAYHERWGAEDWEILAVEQEFRYYLGSAEIGGKLDAVIRTRHDGRVYVLEHKFTGTETSLGGAYWEKLTLDSQVSIYIDGATMLGYSVSGCIYDVIKRPQHEQLTATPLESRKYTLGKGCKRCGGSAGGKAGIVKGRGYYTVSMVTVEEIKCSECKGTGWKLDAEGEPQEPQLHANQRSEDETIEAFEERLLDVIADAPSQWLQRSTVVRLESELPGMRQDVLDDISIAETGLKQRNPDSCAKYGRRHMCEFFQVCTGQADINDFKRGPVHPELDAAI